MHRSSRHSSLSHIAWVIGRSGLLISGALVLLGGALTSIVSRPAGDAVVVAGFAVMTVSVLASAFGIRAATAPDRRTRSSITTDTPTQHSLAS